MTRSLLLLCAVAAGLPVAAAGAAPAAAPHVVIVSVDGLRPDAIAAAGATHLQQLVRDGAASLAARSVSPSLTLPNHLSMVTGLTPQKHHVTTNGELSAEFPGPTLFTAAHDAGLRTALYYGKRKLVALAPQRSADVMHGPGPGNRQWADGDDGALAERFADEFPRQRFALAFVHLRAADGAGHDHGWMSPAYLDAVRAADQALGRVLRAIDQSDIAGSTWVLLTADHGGSGDDHKAPDPLNWTIPWICRGPGIRAGNVLPAGIGNSDIAPTALALLGLPPLLGMEGHAVGECVARK